LLVRAALAASQIARKLPQRLRLSEILLFCDAEESALLAGVSVANGVKKQWEEFASALTVKIPQTKGVEFAVNEGKGRTPRAAMQWGEKSLVYRAAGQEYRVDQGAFFQVNRWLVDALAERATEGRGGALAWDLFAGVGLFARKLAKQFEHVVAVESAPAAAAALAHNLRGASAEAVSETTLDFLRRARTAERSDLIVVDPPRTGLGAETTSLLAALAAPALTYVSCDPATLTRDLRALVASGYAIQSLVVADLFPQTYHLETVARLHR
jgi:23S rRNA (uracil1939-C5)-methyltransferase